MRNSAFCFVLGVIWSTSLTVCAQGRPPLGDPNFVEMEFLTRGGITYFRHASQLSAWCNRIGAYAVSRAGTNLTQAIQEEGWPVGSICACDPIECGPAPRMELTSVLGALTPGTYRLTILSTNEVFQVLPTLRNFAVPPGGEPTLTASRFTGTDLVLLSVAGVAKVNYVVERSADLVNWVPMRTNSNAPFNLSVTPSAMQQFYRVSISPLKIE